LDVATATCGHSAEIRLGAPAWSCCPLPADYFPQVAPALLSPDGSRQSDAISRCTISLAVQ
jgi:hypothetical protein